MRKNFKNTKDLLKREKGITIIALIITIVVLLILAGVTIANISGNDSVPNQAAIQRDKAAIAKEQQILENAAISITNNKNVGKITENSLRNELSSYNVDIVKSGGLYRITFKDSNNLYKMDSEGEFFYWKDMAPTDIYAKLYDDETLILSSTDYTDPYRTVSHDYGKTEDWRSDSFKTVIIHDPIAPKNCSNMFLNCKNMEEIKNIENFHTENVTEMYQMFRRCSNLNKLDLKYFDTSKVKTMKWMFLNCFELTNLDVSSFDTSNVVNMNGMFYSCNMQVLDLAFFNTQSVFDMYNMFYNCTNLKTIYTSSTFTTNSVTSSENMFKQCYALVGGIDTKYDSNNTNDVTYAHVDGGKDDPGYFTLKP